MNLSDYRLMAQEDLLIDETQLNIESSRTPQIHSKYLNFLMDEKLKLAKSQSDFKIIKKKKWLYYTGKISEEELREEQWEPFELSVLKTDIDKFLEADDDIQLISSKLKYAEVVVEYLESVIKIINNRQWNIRAVIDWLKFTNGQ